MNGNTDFVREINKIYEKAGKNMLFDFKNTTSVSEYTMNILFIILSVMFLFLFYLKIHVKKDSKNWGFKKCNPKYLFFSGYVYNDTPFSDSDATLYNFAECTNKMAQGTNDYLVGRVIGRSVNKIKNKLITLDDKNKESQKVRKNNLDKMQADISGQFNAIKNDISFNLDLSGAYVYNSIKNTGIYVDQINGLISYIGLFIKQYLTYRMIEYANNCITSGSCDETTTSYQKAIEINNILKRFGGNNL